MVVVNTNIPYFLDTLNKYLDGIPSGLNIIFGRPSSGKTIFSFNQFLHTLSAHDALYIDAEYGLTYQLINKLLDKYNINTDISKNILHIKTLDELKSFLNTLSFKYKDKDLRLVVIDSMSVLVLNDMLNSSYVNRYQLFTDRMHVLMKMHRYGVENHISFMVIAHYKEPIDDGNSTDGGSTTMNTTLLDNIYILGDLAKYQARRILYLDGKHITVAKDQLHHGMKFEYRIEDGTVLIKVGNIGIGNTNRGV